MKTKLLVLAIFLIGSVNYSQNTNVPDSNFELALIELGYDTGSVDGVVPTANIITIDMLEIPNKNISDLTGIEDFEALNYLDCRGNMISNLDLSQNGGLANLYCINNGLTSLNVSQNPALLVLYCYTNNLTSLDLSMNTHLVQLDCGDNQLTSLDVSSNDELYLLYCGLNQITTLDLRQNVLLEYFWCNSNNLESLNIKNGNNTIMVDFVALNNPNLTCIEVDDASYSNGMWFNIDPQTSFSENCPALSINEPEDPIFKIYPNPVNDFLIIDLNRAASYSIINLTGKILRSNKLSKGVNKVNVSNLSTGLYFLKIKTDEGLVTKKLIKQ